MALDGFFISAYIEDMRHRLEGQRIEKIYQVGTDLILHFRGKAAQKLRLSADSAHPRLLLTDDKLETPDSPPMFCMLMRKHLLGGFITAIEQDGLERVVIFKIAARNDFGDRVEKQLIIEIMGKHSNIILAAEDNKVIDSIKRVNPLMSPRPIGPGQFYGPPPTTKIALHEQTSIDEFTRALLLGEGGAPSKLNAQKAIYTVFSGISPALASSILYKAQIDSKLPVVNLDAAMTEALFDSCMHHLKLLRTSRAPYIYTAPEGQLTDGPTKSIVDFSCVPLYHLQAQGLVESIAPSFDDLMAAVFSKTNDSNKLVQKSSHLIKLLNLLQDRLLSKIANLESDLREAHKLDELKLFGELLTANLWTMTKGMAEVTVQNYYTNEAITIPLDVTKCPNENAQRYYKRYNKAKTTLEEAQFFMVQAEEDFSYLEGVKTLLVQAELPEDVDAIKEELAEQGFMKATTLRKQKKVKKAPPHQYYSSEGVLILVGRNNMQNDELTLKKSHREHIWLHTKDVPGSHVVIQAQFEDVNDQTIVEAACIAAYHSKARYSSQVAVDFTEIKFVKKPKGAKPGMVIYEDNKTLYVTPEEAAITTMKDGHRPV